MGGEKFNGELFGAEHLMIEDEVPHAGVYARKAFGSKIKQLTSCEMQRCNCKHQEAVMLSPRWHLTISLNDEPEDLGVLPQMDSGIADKMMLFKAHKRPFPMPTGTLEERKIFKERIWAELPAFVYWLLHEFIIPDGLRCERFGVCHFHCPEILTALYELSDEVRFLDLVDTHLGYGLPKSLTAQEWERLLRERCPRDEVDRLFRHMKTCGNYMGRLARSHPKRVRSERTRTRREWLVLPAVEEMDACDGCGDVKKQ
jgi:hypothetical protein